MLLGLNYYRLIGFLSRMATLFLRPYEGIGYDIDEFDPNGGAFELCAKVMIVARPLRRTLEGSREV
jgi:hypothetical protein